MRSETDKNHILKSFITSVVIDVKSCNEYQWHRPKVSERREKESEMARLAGQVAVATSTNVDNERMRDQL